MTSKSSYFIDDELNNCPNFKMDEAQLAALACQHSSIVVGGPGTGKTELLIEGVAQRVRSGFELKQILVLTHSRPQAQQLRQQIMFRINRAQIKPQITTLHGYCWWFLRQFSEQNEDLKLLRAPDQEFRLREVLAGADLSSWPGELKAAAGTRAFAAQLRTVLARARQFGLDPIDLVSEQLAENEYREWQQISKFFEEYLTVLDLEQTIDYAELIHRTRILLTHDHVGRALTSQIKEIFVDEFAELDPSQIQLLLRHHQLGIPVHVFVDPQQSVFEFRGSDPAATSEFLALFEGSKRFELTKNYRNTAQICQALNKVSGRISVRGAPPQSSGQDHPKSDIQILVCDDYKSQLHHVANMLRNAHFAQGIDWSEMAVIVRNARTELSLVSSHLSSYGIPVEIHGDEIVLAEQKIVQSFVLGLELLLNPENFNTKQVISLLTSPLCGLDTIELRALGRELRQANKNSSLTSEALIADLVFYPESSVADNAVGERVIEFGKMLAQLKKQLKKDEPTRLLLWRMWQFSKLEIKLRNAALSNKGSAYRPNASLDALVELFDLAGQSDDFSGPRGLRAFLAELAGRQIPADTERESDIRGRGVRVLTAHRVKGQQWDQVFLVGLQEGNWPKLNQLNLMLSADRITAEGVLATQIRPNKIASERKLFYLAASRAKRKLIITASYANADTSEQISRFIDGIGVSRRVFGRPQRALNLTELVTHLRQAIIDPEKPLSLRKAAANRLAKLDKVPAADPHNWWGIKETTHISEDNQQLRFSGSSLGMLLECPRRWFLSRKVKADRHQTASASFGSIIHLLAKHSVDGKISQQQCNEYLDQVWGKINFEAKWIANREREEARQAVSRLYQFKEKRPNELLGVEVDFAVNIEINDRTVELVGTVDRLELDQENRLKIIDFKTGSKAPSAKKVSHEEQLGVYQLAAKSGAFDSVSGSNRKVSSAELVYLRLAGKTSLDPKIFTQPSLDNVADPENGYPTWVHAKLAEAVSIVENKYFVAKVCDSCRFCVFADSCPALQQDDEVIL